MMMKTILQLEISPEASSLPEPSGKHSQKQPAGVSAAASSSCPETAWTDRTEKNGDGQTCDPPSVGTCSDSLPAYLSSDMATSMRTWW